MKRVGSFAERQRTKGQTGRIGPHYVCGCGCDTWILCKNGDCICSQCLTAQARIIVNELAPVSEHEPRYVCTRNGVEKISDETSAAPCEHTWVTSNFEPPRCLFCYVEKSESENDG